MKRDGISRPTRALHIFKFLITIIYAFLYNIRSVMYVDCNCSVTKNLHYHFLDHTITLLLLFQRIRDYFTVNCNWTSFFFNNSCRISFYSFFINNTIGNEDFFLATMTANLAGKRVPHSHKQWLSLFAKQFGQLVLCYRFRISTRTIFIKQDSGGL